MDVFIELERLKTNKPNTPIQPELLLCSQCYWMSNDIDGGFNFLIAPSLEFIYHPPIAALICIKHQGPMPWELKVK